MGKYIGLALAFVGLVILGLFVIVAVALGFSGSGENPSTGTEGPANSSELRRKIVETAKQELGTGEQPPGSNNVPKYNANGIPWCSAFVSWVWDKAGVKIPFSPYCGDVGKWANAHTEYKTGKPEPGDAILYGSSNDSCDHIGIVIDVKGDKITTVEGNWSDKVSQRTMNWETNQSPAGVYGFAAPEK